MNSRTHKTNGLTLIEMTLVIATIALLVGFGLPAVRSMIRSFETQDGTRSVIAAALSSARAMAIKNQRYAGVRFQKKCTSASRTDPLNDGIDAPQYMIFIMHEEPGKMGGLTIGFRALPGREPIKLPDTIGVIDLTGIDHDDEINQKAELNDATAFSIIFSPSGKLIVHNVRTRNRDGVHLPVNSGSQDDPNGVDESWDEIFNSVENIVPNTATDKDNVGKFIQDDYPQFGLDQEASRTSFVIYERQRLKSTFEKETAWSEYLSLIPADAEVYVSPYTGTLITSE